MKKTASNKKKKVEFNLQAEPGKNIFLAGTFNNWNPIRMKQKNKEEDLYTITLHLPPVPGDVPQSRLHSGCKNRQDSGCGTGKLRCFV